MLWGLQWFSWALSRDLDGGCWQKFYKCLISVTKFKDFSHVALPSPWDSIDLSPRMSNSLCNHQVLTSGDGEGRKENRRQEARITPASQAADPLACFVEPMP